MRRKLYAVDVDMTITLMVVAESHVAAERIAEEHATEEAENQGSPWNASPAREVDSDRLIDEEWRRAIPYGGDGNTPTEKVLAAILAEKPRP